MTLESEGARIVRIMRELGFNPQPGDASRVAFAKDYADNFEDGPQTFARVTVYFDKPIMGQAAVRLANIVVSHQTAISPSRDEIQQHGGIATNDLLCVAQHFAEYVDFIPDQAAPAATRECIKCAAVVAEFYLVNGDAICLECVAARKRGQR